MPDRAVIDRHVTRIIVLPDLIDIELREPTLATDPLQATEGSIAANVPASSICTTVISPPWTAQAFPSVKGVLHQPEAKPTLKQETREVILLAVAKARSWIDHLTSGRVRSFAEIAEREGKVERHSHATCVHPATYTGRNHRRHGSARCDRDGAGPGGAISMGPQSCRPRL
jgi:hypothetical protein